LTVRKITRFLANVDVGADRKECEGWIIESHPYSDPALEIVSQEISTAVAAAAAVDIAAISFCRLA